MAHHRTSRRKVLNRKTRRRLRGGQDKFSPLARALTKSRTFEKEVTPEMREKAASVNRSLANLDRLAATSKTPAARRGIEESRARISRGLHPAVRAIVANADVAKAELLGATYDPSIGVPRKRKHG